jgi:hypothetical protein
MIYTINNKEPVTYTLVEGDETASILQNIALLIQTWKGTVPMYREFGLPMEWVNKQVPIAEVIAAQEVEDAIEAFEPRVRLIDVRVKGELDTGKLYIEVEVEI